MPLAKRIIPCLDVDEGRVVKGVKFVDIRDAGDPVEAAAMYDRQGADELAFLDITASSSNRDTIVHIVEAVANQVFIPLTVGGGVRNVENIRNLLNAGADKISINTSAVENPEFIEEAAGRFGSQCIVVAIGRAQGAGCRPRQPGRSILMAGANRAALMQSNGLSGCTAPGQVKYCSPAWTGTAQKSAST